MQRRWARRLWSLLGAMSNRGITLGKWQSPMASRIILFVIKHCVILWRSTVITIRPLKLFKRRNRITLFPIFFWTFSSFLIFTSKVSNENDPKLSNKVIQITSFRFIISQTDSYSSFSRCERLRIKFSRKARKSRIKFLPHGCLDVITKNTGRAAGSWKTNKKRNRIYAWLKFRDTVRQSYTHVPYIASASRSTKSISTVPSILNDKSKD